MDLTVNAFPGSTSIIAAIIYFGVLGLVIYLMFLLIKALRIYKK